MANVVTTNPILCDTAGVLKVDEPTYLKAIAWVSDQASGSDIAADDDMLLSDSDGNRIIGKRASFAGDGLEMWHFPEHYCVNGLTMTTIDGGLCYIFL